MPKEPEDIFVKGCKNESITGSGLCLGDQRVGIKKQGFSLGLMLSESGDGMCLNIR